MRPVALLLLAAMAFSGIGCFRKASIPEPTKKRIVLHGIVDFNKASIRPDSVPLLKEVAATLKDHADAHIVAAGHSDSQGSEAYNEELSLRRATSVRNFLVELGVPSDRILVVGKGSKEPIASNATREGRAQNRRVELEVYEE